jgi:hypothetical protein
MASVLDERFGSEIVHWIRAPAGMNCARVEPENVIANRNDERTTEGVFMACLLISSSVIEPIILGPPHS